MIIRFLPHGTTAAPRRGEIEPRGRRSGAPRLTWDPFAPYKRRNCGFMCLSLRALPRHDRARRRSLETHLSTIAARPQEAPRFSRPYGDDRRAQGARTAQGQGAQASVGLSRHGPPVTAIGRLKTRAEFLHVRGGARFVAPSLVLQARKRDREIEPRQLARFGFTATKALGGAVLRNRARRRLKEAVRLAGAAGAVEGYDYVLIAREGTVQRRFADLIKDLERALAKVHEPSQAKKR